MFIAQDVDEIVSEIVIEAMLDKQNLLANMTSLTLSKRILLEAEKLEILNKQCEKLEEEIKEMKKVINLVVNDIESAVNYIKSVVSTAMTPMANKW